MIIELYGLPGSGKSTLAKQLVNLDSSFVLVDFSNKLERYFYLFIYIINNPISFYHWLIFLLANKKLFKYKLHLLSLAMAKMQKAKSIKNKKVLIDEGFLQRILGISDNKLDNSMLIKLLKYLNNVNHIVVLEEGTFSRFTKERQKDNSPRVQLGSEYLEQWIKLSKYNDVVIQQYLQTLKNIKINNYNLIANLSDVERQFQKITLDLVD